MANSLHPLVIRGRDALARGDLRAVEAAADERLRLAGRDVNALELRYIAQKSRGAFTEASRTLQTVIGIDSRADWAFNALIQLLMTHGKRADAEQVARTALRANPDNRQANSLFGALLSEAEQYPAGEWHLRRAVELGDEEASTFVSLALNLMKQGRMAEADELFTRAHDLSPEDPKILTQWSTLQAARGNLSRAQELLNSAQALITARTQSTLPLTHTPALRPEPHAQGMRPAGQGAPTGQATAASESLVEQAVSSVGPSIALLRADYLSRSGRHEQALAVLDEAGTLTPQARLARGRLFERLGRYSDAWREFTETKHKLAGDVGGLQYRADAIEAFFEKLKRFFTRDHVLRLPRASRRTDLAQPVFILGFPRSGTALIERILRSHPAIAAGGELPFLADLPKLAGHLLPGTDAFPSNLAQSWTADHRQIATIFRDYYLARAEYYAAPKSGRRFFTDRMPFNEIHLPLLRMAFPEAKIVRVVRHPLDICISVLSTPLPAGFHSAYRIEDTTHHLCALFDLAEHYRAALEPNELVVRYESVIEDPAGQARRLFEFLALSPEEKFTEKLDPSSVGRHRHYAAELKQQVGRLARLMKAHDYL